MSAFRSMSMARPEPRSLRSCLPIHFGRRIRPITGGRHSCGGAADAVLSGHDANGVFRANILKPSASEMTIAENWQQRTEMLSVIEDNHNITSPLNPHRLGYALPSVAGGVQSAPTPFVVGAPNRSVQPRPVCAGRVDQGNRPV